MTRYGVLAIIAGLASIAIGRVFGVIELFVIGSAFLAACVAAAIFVALRTPQVIGSRRVRPSILVAGDTGRVDLELEHRGALRSTRFSLAERVSRKNAPDHIAELLVEPMSPAARAGAGYQLPTNTRGLIQLGPLVAETRDPLGLLRRVRTVAGIDTVTVAPRAHPLDMPELGSGPLGRHLLAQARRLGPGEFHSLREYADGDEPRTIHWRASARTDKLLVKQHSIEGLRRMLVVLDAHPDSYRDEASFERAITVAASLVKSASDSGLTTRFVTADTDLRGPDVAVNTLRTLAGITASRTHVTTLDRDPGEGVGLLCAITGSLESPLMATVRSTVDPTQSKLVVTTDVAARDAVAVSARTEAEFLSSWSALVGRASTRPVATATIGVA